jgi:hypothetical protein
LVETLSTTTSEFDFSSVFDTVSADDSTEVEAMTGGLGFGGMSSGGV